MLPAGLSQVFNSCVALHKPKTNNMNFKNIKEGFLKIWKDPVWSKVISAGIIALIAVIWAKITNHSWAEIYEFIIKVLSFQLPVYIFLSVIGLYFIVKLCIKLFKKRKDPLWDEQMGNYTFKELYNILITETFPVTTMGMQMSGRAAPNDDLLMLFRMYYTYLNKGIDFDDNIQDGGYLYGVLAPKLVGYGLVEAFEKPLRDLPDQTEVAYKTSELGHRFHASLEKVILPEKIKEYKEKMQTQK
jgi:hypothetical protein